jgi:hypothetical protein
MIHVELGRRYRDPISSWEGTATGIFTYLNGCRRVCISGVLNGQPKEFTFDEPQLELVPDAVVIEVQPVGSGRGGPRPNPPRTGH